MAFGIFSTLDFEGVCERKGHECEVSDMRVPAGSDLPTVLTADWLVDGTGRPETQGPAVVVRDGKIEAVLDRETWRDHVPESVTLLEFEGATLMPGMIDGHVHLVMSAADTTPTLLEDLDGVPLHELAFRSAENARRCLGAGVTTVRDCGGTGTLTQSLRDAINAGLIEGPRILSSGMPVTTTAGHCNFLGLRADSSEEVRKAVRELVESRVDFVKVMASGGRITSDSNIFALQYSEQDLELLCAEAHRLSRRVAAHVLFSEGIRACVNAGVDTLEHCRWQDPAGHFDYNESVLGRIEQQGTFVSLTMAGNIRDLLALRRSSPGKFALGEVERERFRTEADMVRRGLNTFVTSDAGVTRTKFDQFYLSVACACEFLGLAPTEAVEHVTSRAAQALGIAHDVGTIEPGRIADLVVVHGDVSKDVDSLKDVHLVVKGGRVVAKDGAVIAAGDFRRQEVANAR